MKIYGVKYLKSNEYVSFKFTKKSAQEYAKNYFLEIHDYYSVKEYLKTFKIIEITVED